MRRTRNHGSITIGSDCTRRWATDLRKNLSDRTRVEGSAADSRSATMQFFENDENKMRVSTKLAGEGHSITVPFPRPPSPARGYTEGSIKRASVPKEFVSMEGFRAETWEQFGNNNVRIPYKIVKQGARKTKTNQQDRQPALN